MSTYFKCEYCHEIIEEGEIGQQTIRGRTDGYGLKLEPDDVSMVCPKCGRVHDEFTEMDNEEWYEHYQTIMESYNELKQEHKNLKLELYEQERGEA